MEQTTVRGRSDRGGGSCQLLSEMKQEPLRLKKGTLQEAVKALRARQAPLGGLTQGGSRGKARFPFTSQPRTDTQASPSGSPSLKRKSRLETGAKTAKAAQSETKTPQRLTGEERRKESKEKGTPLVAQWPTPEPPNPSPTGPPGTKRTAAAGNRGSMQSPTFSAH